MITESGVTKSSCAMITYYLCVQETIKLYLDLFEGNAHVQCFPKVEQVADHFNKATLTWLGDLQNY